MMEHALEVYKLNVTSTIIPMIVLTLFVVLNFYRGIAFKQRLVGAFLTTITSYFGMYTVQYWIYVGIKALFARFGMNNLAAVIIVYVETICVIFLFSTLFAKTLKYRNKYSPYPKIRPSFGAFVYAQYMIVIYTAMLFADNLMQVHIMIFVLTIVWFITFGKDFKTISKIYPKEIRSVENICLIFQVSTVLMIWFIPQTFTANDMATQKLFFEWLKVLSLVAYIFSLVVHKVIFLQTLHRNKALEVLKHDVKTGLYSREYFMEKGQEYISKADENNKGYKICFVNFCRFRFLNLNYGNAKCDELLQLFAKKIKAVLPEGNLAARISADQFVLLLEDDVNIDTQLLSIRKELIDETQITNIQLKVGFYKIEGRNHDIQSAIDAAMLACQKAAGNNTVSECVFDDKLMKEREHDAYIIANIDRALKEGKIKVYYQPIVNLKQKNICSAEALARWDDDVLGFLQPAKFIPLLENENLIYKVDCYVAEQICKDQRKLLDQNVAVYPVGFNISRKDFFITDMVEYVESMVEKYHIPRDLIKIEITESALSDDEGFINKQISRFREKGYKVWMDDFGSGYSSLNSLGNLHFTGIKLDMVFLRDLTPEKIKIIKGIVETAKTMGLEVLCEGVETKEQLDVLMQVGCENAQGFKFSSPLSLENHLRIAATGAYAPGGWNFE